MTQKYSEVEELKKCTEEISNHFTLRKIYAEDIRKGLIANIEVFME